MVEIGIFTALAFFLKATSLICEAQLSFSCSLSPWSAHNCKYEWEYTSEIFHSIISRGVNSFVQCVFEKKNINFIMRFPPIFNCFSSMKG